MHTIPYTTISQSYVNQASKRGLQRQQGQPRSVTCSQRCSGAIHLQLDEVHALWEWRVPMDRYRALLTESFERL